MIEKEITTVAIREIKKELEYKELKDTVGNTKVLLAKKVAQDRRIQGLIAAMALDAINDNFEAIQEAQRRNPNLLNQD